MNYADHYQHSIDDPEGYWSKEAQRIEWHRPFTKVIDYNNPPFANWFVGGETNLCHNAVDRWVATQGDKPALIAISTETVDGTPDEKTWSFRELQAEIERTAAILISLGVGKGDMVLIYMPMIAEATFAMLACARIGAIHSVVFGGFASNSLATRIDDAKPKLIISADAGSRAGKPIPYKPLLDEAIKLAEHKPAHVLMVNRGLAAMEMTAGRDVDYAALRQEFIHAKVPVTWLASDDISYILYTSGTTGKPKGVQRDVGGYAVALASSMQQIFCATPGETYFATSDIGWVVGHSYIVYGPLIAGMATIMYEGLPTQGMDGQPDGGVWWSLVEKYKVTGMFSAPTAVRVLKKQDPALLKKYDLSSLRALYLAGEPLDAPTARWISEGLNVPIIDNYWQTETGWPLLTVANGVAPMASKFGSPGVPMYGYNVKLLHENTGEELIQPNEKGVVVLDGPTPPGFMQTIWKDDARFVNTYWKSIPGKLVYNTFDWGIRDEDGYYFILGRTDDVINVAGHRLGTREIEESISGHAAVAEVAVVGVADNLKGQVAMAFVVLKDASAVNDPALSLQLEREIMKQVDGDLGAVARPARVRFVTALPKTRSGKLLRRVIQAICEGRDAGDVTSMDDPAALQQIKDRMAS